MRRSWPVLTTVRWGPLVVDEGWGGGHAALWEGLGAGGWGRALGVRGPPPAPPTAGGFPCVHGGDGSGSSAQNGGVPADPGSSPPRHVWGPLVVGWGWGGIASFGLDLGAHDKCMLYLYADI